MHYSAKRGLAIACRLSVCPSVTLVDQDHIGWKSWKLIARSISLTSSLFVAQRSSTYSQRNMENFLGRLGWGGKKWRAGTQKRQYLWNALRQRKSYYGGPIASHQRFFEWYHPRPPTTSSSPRLGFTTHNQNSNCYYLRNGWSTTFKFGQSIHMVHQNKNCIARSSLQ